MNILFIYPNINSQVGFNFGISSISALLKRHGHSTKLINLNEKLGAIPDDKEIIETIRSFEPGLIGFSIVTPQYQYALRVARLIKASCNVPIICGGIHATMVPEEILQEDCFDYACIGEGEYSMLDLATRLEDKEDTLNIPGIWAKDNGKIIKNKVRPFPDIKGLPQKDYEIFDLQKMIDVEGGWVRLMASRGCPFRCTYCFNHQIVNLYEKDTGVRGPQLNYIRRHSVEEVLSEINFLLTTYKGIKTFIFDDDIFTFDMEFLSEFCSSYPRVSRIPIVVNAHVKVFNNERAELLKNAGCKIVKFGVESGSERIRREILRRPMSNKEIIDAFQIAHKYGLHTSAFILLGLPYETKEDILETIELLRIIRPGRFRWALFYPFPKTTAYEISLKGGYIDFKKMKTLTNFTDESCLDFSPEHNLFISKLKLIMPWYVNIDNNSNLPVARQTGKEIFTGLTRMVESLTSETWDNMKNHISSLEKQLAMCLSLTNTEYYSTRYNSFTAVKSSWKDE